MAVTEGDLRALAERATSEQVHPANWRHWVEAVLMAGPARDYVAAAAPVVVMALLDRLADPRRALRAQIERTIGALSAKPDLSPVERGNLGAYQDVLNQLAVHQHQPQYPSTCTGCEHLAADLADRLPIGLLPVSRVRRWLLDEGRPEAVALDQTCSHASDRRYHCDSHDAFWSPDDPVCEAVGSPAVHQAKEATT